MEKEPDSALIERHLDKLRQAQTSGQPRVLAVWMATVDERTEALRNGVNVVGRDLGRGWAAFDTTVDRIHRENQKLAERVAVLESDMRIPRPLTWWQRSLIAFGTLGTGFLLASMLILMILTLRR